MIKEVKVTIALLIAFSLALFGCTGKTTIGDGKIDEVEEASLRLAVGMAMSARPETVVPAYAVSGALLQMMGWASGDVVVVDYLDQAIGKEVEKLTIDKSSKQSFFDLVTLVKAKVKSDIPVESSQKIVIVKQVLFVVNESAKARMVK